MKHLVCSTGQWYRTKLNVQRRRLPNICASSVVHPSTIGQLLGGAVRGVCTDNSSSKREFVQGPESSWPWNANEGGFGSLFFTLSRSFVASIVPSRSRIRI